MYNESMRLHNKVSISNESRLHNGNEIMSKLSLAMFLFFVETS